MSYFSYDDGIIKISQNIDQALKVELNTNKVKVELASCAQTDYAEGYEGI